MPVRKYSGRKRSANKDHHQAVHILLGGCITVAALVVGISLLFYNVYKRSLSDEMISYSTRALDSTDIMVSEVFQQIENIAYQQTLATARLVNTSQRDIVHDYYRLQQLTDGLINMKNSHSYIHSSYIYFNQGSVIVTSFMGTTSLSLFYDTDWLDVYRAHASEVVWINGRKPYSARYSDNPQAYEKYMSDTSDVLTLLVPLSSSMRNRGGVVVINVYESEIAKLLSNTSDGTETMGMMMVDDQGRIVVSAARESLYSNLPDEIFCRIRENDQPQGYFHYRQTDGEEFICVYTESRFNNNYMLQMLPISQILAPTSNLLRDIMLCAGLFLIISLALTITFMYLSHRPVRQLYRELGKSLSGSPEDNTADIQHTIVKIVQDNRTLTKLWENNRMLIKHRTLSMMLQGKLTESDADEKRLESLEICFPHQYFSCCVLHLGTSQHAPVILDEKYELIKMQMFPLIQQCIEPLAGYTVDLDDLDVAIILNSDADTPGYLLNFCQKVQQTLKKSQIVPYVVSIGVGSYTSEMIGLALSFRQACSAMRYTLAHCPGEIVSFSSICIEQISTEWANLPEEEELLDAVRIGDSASAIRHLSEWFLRLRQTGITLEAMKQAAVRQVGRIMSLLPEIGLAISGADSIAVSKILQVTEEKQIQTFMTDLITKICNQIQSRRANKNAQTMENIIQYIRGNYQKEISLNQIAEDVYMSVPYLCKIFKEYTNQTFMDYLTSLRIEASVELLRNSSKKIREIASSVGYINVQSYIRAFKKAKNMTPSEFRESLVSDKLQK